MISSGFDKSLRMELTKLPNYEKSLGDLFDSEKNRRQNTPEGSERGYDTEQRTEVLLSEDRRDTEYHAGCRAASGFPAFPDPVPEPAGGGYGDPAG